MRVNNVTPSQQDFERYFQAQVLQTGYGILPGFQGLTYQRGQGLGSFFRGLFRVAKPVIRKVAPILGKRALVAAEKALDDFGEGAPLLPTLKKRGKEAMTQSIGDLHGAFNQQYQSGNGLGIRKRKNIKGAMIKRRKQNTQQLDIFGSK